jgi:hypothetical protein
MPCFGWGCVSEGELILSVGLRSVECKPSKSFSFIKGTALEASYFCIYYQVIEQSSATLSFRVLLGSPNLQVALKIS